MSPELQIIVFAILMYTVGACNEKAIQLRRDGKNSAALSALLAAFICFCLALWRWP